MSGARIDAANPAAEARAFRLPFEHGAWWTLHTCLAAGLVQALAWKAPLPAALFLALAMESLFLASDWITGLAQLALEGRLKGRSDWKAPQGWFLGALGFCSGLLSLFLAPAGARPGLAAVMAISLALIAVVLRMRLKLPPRDIRLLAVSAVLLSLPTYLLAGLGMGFGARALGYWALWAWFFAWGVFYVQAWLRGNTLPRWRIVAASLPFIAQALLLAFLSRWPGVIVLSLLSARIIWRLRLRLFEFSHPDGRPHLATTPKEIRALGFEQVAWSLALTAIWIWRYWPAA